VVRIVELALGVQCSDTDYEGRFSNSAYTSSVDLGILAVAKLVEPTIATILSEVSTYLPSVLTQLGLSELHLKRALSGNDNARTPAGHRAGRGRLGVYGPVGGPKTRPESPGDAEPNVEVPHGSGLERHKRRKHRARGISATLSKDVQRECLITS
jgi:hypothetical protein